MMTKKELSILLSRLRLFENPDVALEQHPTDSEVAGDALWLAYMQGDIDGKVVADLGCGTGILGLGALLLGAKKAYLVDVDAGAIELAMLNKQFLEQKTSSRLDAAFSVGDVNIFDEKVDTVIMNPPFGTKNKNIDTAFLLKAMSIASIIYSFHKASTKSFIDRLISESDFKATHYQEYDFPLKMSMSHHTKKIEKIRVGLWRITRHIKKR
jgi:putative methylase